MGNKKTCILTKDEREYLKKGRAKLVEESKRLAEDIKQKPYIPNLKLSQEEREEKYNESSEHKKELKDGKKRSMDKVIRDKTIAILPDLLLIAQGFPYDQKRKTFADDIIIALIDNILFPIKEEKKGAYIRNERIYKLGLRLSESTIEAAYRCLDARHRIPTMGAKAQPDELWLKCEIIKNAEVHPSRLPQDTKKKSEIEYL